MGRRDRLAVLVIPHGHGAWIDEAGQVYPLNSAMSDDPVVTSTKQPPADPVPEPTPTPVDQAPESTSKNEPVLKQPKGLWIDGSTVPVEIFVYKDAQDRLRSVSLIQFSPERLATLGLVEYVIKGEFTIPTREQLTE
jgi:hypothetical protein